MTALGAYLRPRSKRHCAHPMKSSLSAEQSGASDVTCTGFLPSGENCSE